MTSYQSINLRMRKQNTGNKHGQMLFDRSDIQYICVINDVKFVFVPF